MNYQEWKKQYNEVIEKLNAAMELEDWGPEYDALQKEWQRLFDIADCNPEFEGEDWWEGGAN